MELKAGTVVRMVDQWRKSFSGKPLPGEHVVIEDGWDPETVFIETGDMLSPTWLQPVRQMRYEEFQQFIEKKGILTRRTVEGLKPGTRVVFTPAWIRDNPEDAGTVFTVTDVRRQANSPFLIILGDRGTVNHAVIRIVRDGGAVQ